MIGGLQPIHILVIVLIALIIFVPGRIPLVARGMKKMVSEFKKEVGGPDKSEKPDVSRK